MKNYKIIMLSDIHANIYALNRLLDYAECQKIEMILNCGDFLQIGPNPVEVFDIVMSDERFINIIGNNELSLWKRDLMEFDESEKEHQNWVIKLIGLERLEKLKNLPKARIVNIENYRFLMIHARINNIIEMPLLYQSKPIEEYTTDYGDDCDYVILGHTHLQSFISYWKGKTIINPGSLGCSKDGTISFVIFNINQEGIGFEFKKLKYNYYHTISDLMSLGVPAKEKIINKFYK
ncbi:metallophosphoesterase family protein [Herbivorax sp. ANBcel31]|uniref:metallophosphoesterase family protein n=1 Tax=Herbivorax sp. ANBcel31 TaxID=3069754 RepID=UPI0027B5AC86|nr:metallophosphoesterase family protein [Herbivorax sp. ANBcel31]MDQ2086872.1 metallophosphoesterase family protein [Herbivorax sp. ANBcel31]